MKALTNNIAALTTFSDSNTNTVWENMEDHNSFNLRSIEPTDKVFSETFRKGPNGSLYTTVGDDFYSPETQDITTEYIQDDILDGLDSITYTDCSAASAAFISLKQKEINLDFFSRKIEEAKTEGSIKYLGFVIFSAIEGSKRTFDTSEGEEITVPTFFPKDTMSTLWKAYNLKKKELGTAKLVSANDYLISLSKTNSPKELEAWRVKFNSERMNKATKAPIWKAYYSKKNSFVIQEMEELLFGARDTDSIRACKVQLSKLPLKADIKAPLWDLYNEQAHKIYNPAA